MDPGSIPKAKMSASKQGANNPMHGRASHNAKAVYLYELKAKALIVLQSFPNTPLNRWVLVNKVSVSASKGRGLKGG
jgi:hypothetical protein